MKEPRQVEDTSLFDECINEAPQEVKNFVDNSLEIAHQIYKLMENKGLLQKDLAKLLAKSEAEISRMLSGSHNLTIKTISKIEAVLDGKIITTPFRVEEERIELDTCLQMTATASNMIDNEKNHWERSEVGKYSFAMAS